LSRRGREFDLTLQEAALQLGLMDEKIVDRAVNPTRMVGPNVASAT
jgi:fumarate hydratase class II